MESELTRLIDKIKKDGVEKARNEAESIIKCAEEKAKAITQDADKAAGEIIAKAGKKAEDFKINSERTLERASRDVLLTLRGRVVEFFDRIVREKVSEQFTTDVVKESIVKAAESFKKDGSLDIEVLVNEKEREKLEKALFQALSKDVKGHILVKGAPGIDRGFRIGEQGKDSYIDFTDDAVTEAFKQFLNPKLIEMLDAGLGMNKEGKK